MAKGRIIALAALMLLAPASIKKDYNQPIMRAPWPMSPSKLAVKTTDTVDAVIKSAMLDLRLHENPASAKEMYSKIREIRRQEKEKIRRIRMLKEEIAGVKKEGHEWNYLEAYKLKIDDLLEELNGYDSKEYEKYKKECAAEYHDIMKRIDNLKSEYNSPEARKYINEIENLIKGQVRKENIKVN
jgi:hypothetical protein